MIFQETPKDFKKEMDVVACYIQHDNKILLLHRQPHKHNGNAFGLPAGKVDPGESIDQAIHREIKEETGLHIPKENMGYIDSLPVRHDNRDFMYHTFITHFPIKPEVTINPKEHQQYLWTSPTEALRLDLVLDLDQCIKIHYKI